MTQSLYIYGPAGCGKTTNAQKLKKYFGLDHVLDDYYDQDRRTILYTGTLIIGQSALHAPKGVRSMSYSEAAAVAGIPLKARK